MEDEIRTLNIKKSTWKILTQIKLDEEYKSLDDVIIDLLKRK